MVESFDMEKWAKRSSLPTMIGVPKKIVSEMMISRGIDPSDAQFSSSPLSSLSDPSSLGGGASLAADMILGCSGTNSAVIGDYDADGVMSSAIIKRTIEIVGGKCDVFLPSRWKHGYGLNDKTVGSFIKRFSGKMPKQLFVLDCGSSSEKHVVELKQAGIKKVAIIDHHIVDPANESKSADAHVNWRLKGTAKNLCASGEAFQVARMALSRASMDWGWALPFAAAATVGDSVEVSGDNRVLVRNGADYSRMIESSSPGLVSLVSKRCKSGVSQKSLAFYVVPRINAAGRMGDPDVALEFLMEKDPMKAMELMGIIETFNDSRKKVQDEIFRSGIGMIGGPDANPGSVFLHDPGWNIGVCGISCSQMVEKYGVPAMMFGTYEGKIKGSGRSIPGINIKAILDSCGEDVFERYGGHEMACGAIVRGGMFSEAKRRFSEAISKIAKIQPIAVIPRYDADIDPACVTTELGNYLFETLYPSCPNTNPEPIFRISSGKVKSIEINKFKVFSKLDVRVEKDGVEVPIPMSAFLKDGVDDEMLSLQAGSEADFFFSFPQTVHSEFGFGYEDYVLELVDVELRQR